MNSVDFLVLFVVVQIVVTVGAVRPHRMCVGVCVCFFPACGSEQCQGLLQRLKLSKVRLCLDSADYCGLREL